MILDTTKATTWTDDNTGTVMSEPYIRITHFVELDQTNKKCIFEVDHYFDEAARTAGRSPVFAASSYSVINTAFDQYFDCAALCIEGTNIYRQAYKYLMENVSIYSGMKSDES